MTFYAIYGNVKLQGIVLPLDSSCSVDGCFMMELNHLLFESMQF